MSERCKNCAVDMKDALLNSSASFCIQKKDKTDKPYLCNVDVKVCPECGFVELYAENPQIFKE